MDTSVLFKEFVGGCFRLRLPLVSLPRFPSTHTRSAGRSTGPSRQAAAQCTPSASRKILDIMVDDAIAHEIVVVGGGGVNACEGLPTVTLDVQSVRDDRDEQTDDCDPLLGRGEAQGANMLDSVLAKDKEKSRCSICFLQYTSIVALVILRSFFLSFFLSFFFQKKKKGWPSALRSSRTSAQSSRFPI